MQRKDKILLISIAVFLVAISIIGGFLIGKYTSKGGNADTPTDDKKQEETPTESKGDLIDISSGLEFESKVFTYDGKAHEIVVTGNIPSTMFIAYVNNGKTDVGTYQVTAYLVDSSGKYTFPQQMTATLTISPAEMNMDLNVTELHYQYTGEEIECVIPDLDERFSVTYYNNKHTEVGRYEMMAIVHDTLGQYNDIILAATMIIEDANDFGIYMDDLTVPYTGEEYTLLAYGNIDKYELIYTNNVQTNAGEYSVSCKIVDPTGEKEAITLISTFIITQKEMEVTFEGASFLFDGASHRIDVTGLLPGFEVTYENNDKVEVGEYEVTATVTDTNGNYKTTVLKANLTISGDLILEMKDKRIAHDGQPHMLEVEGTLISTLEIKFYNADTDEEIESYTDKGVYNIKAIVTDTSGRYNSQTLTGTLTIVDSYKVVFRYAGATIKTIYVEKNGKVEDYPPVPEEPGYTLEWEVEVGDPNNVTRDLAFDVRRVLVDYTITYVTHYNVDSMPKKYNKSASDIILDDLEVDGYIFVGWFLDQDYTDQIEKIEANHTGDLTLYPYLVPRTYTITYNVDCAVHGIQTETVYVAYNNPVKLLEKTVENHKVIRWVNELENLSFDPGQRITYEYSKNITLNAITVDPNYTFEVTVLNKKVTLETFLGSGLSGDENILIPEYYYYNDEWLPVEKIGDSAFKNYANKNSIQSIVIPSGIKRIGDSVFEGLTGLKTVTLPSTVDNIGSSAFKGCTNLETINLESVVTIKGFAFQNCTKLTTVDCSSVNVLRQEVFDNSGLTTITLKNITGIETDALDVAGPVSIYFDGTKAEFDALNLTNLPSGYILYCKVNGVYVQQV